ncbi:hypothetical protein CIG75_17020 [Tumebacillus algifaecis]|uniref:Peptidase C-terminal archaeal/bacterial domain-containing protein n=1 Tax=Tumebacillus algifaecis TaxID=1214604 RepID=A0A223D4I5_9BACL|nr:hypothetical protein [Tumebacillus algifaecis]ASS76492.1 hypothetical protein CIG75_17020 [Tumebacillus algifaecis]
MKKLVAGMLTALVLASAVAPHGVNAATGGDSYENNDSFADAKRLQTAFGAIAVLANLWGTPTRSTATGEDEDFFEILGRGQNFEITLQIPSASFALDYDLELYDENYNLVGFSRNGSNKDEKIVKYLDNRKKYYIRVYSYLSHFTTNDYVLTGIAR